MASSSSRVLTSRAGVLLGLLAACGACTASPTRAVAPAFEPGVELPEGRGRDILFAACLSCHELTALPLFKAFYTRDSWRTLVLTMREHGARVDDAEVEALADYLAQHFGVQPAG